MEKLTRFCCISMNVGGWFKCGPDKILLHQSWDLANLPSVKLTLLDCWKQMSPCKHLNRKRFYCQYFSFFIIFNSCSSLKPVLESRVCQKQPLCSFKGIGKVYVHLPSSYPTCGTILGMLLLL
uniref:Uncharacterized protein n=1 Tax=Solanum tuberosum TaxID=4113 RepID=M1ABH6_SOLTU